MQLHSGTLNVIAKGVKPLTHVTLEAQSLPRAPERNGVPGNPHDKREAAAVELAMSAPPSTTPLWWNVCDAAVRSRDYRSVPVKL